MGISPSELLAMSIYDYQAATHHWIASQQDGGSEPDPLSASDFDDMLGAIPTEAMN